MKPHPEPPGWFTAMPFAWWMVYFLALAIGAVRDHHWLDVAIYATGILIAAVAWYITGVLRDRIAIAQRQQVRDAYKVAALEADLRRAREWNP